MTVDTGVAGRLIAVLRSAAHTPGLEYERRPKPMQGGFWAELFSFSLANPPAGWPAELINGPVFARRLARLTGVQVRAR